MPREPRPSEVSVTGDDFHFLSLAWQNCIPDPSFLLGSGLASLPSPAVNLCLLSALRTPRAAVCSILNPSEDNRGEQQGASDPSDREGEKSTLAVLGY